MCKTSIAVQQVTEVKLLFLFLLKGSYESEKEEKKRQVHVYCYVRYTVLGTLHAVTSFC